MGARIHARVSVSAGLRSKMEWWLAEVGLDVTWLASDAELEAVLGEVEVVLCGAPIRVDWTQATRLRLLHVLGSGVELLHGAPGLCAEAVVTNSRGIHGNEMRDHVLCMMLAFARELPRVFHQQHERRFEQFAAGTLSGCTLGILGLGHVGRSVAEGAAALGMRVIGTRAHPQATPFVDRVGGPNDTLEVLRASDYVLVSVPATTATRGLLGARELSVLPGHAVLVHVSRGGVVDEAALVEALGEGRLRGAALDVFSQEPLPENSPFWGLSNVIVSPHYAGTSADYLQRALGVFLQNLELLAAGREPLTRVDLARGY